MKPRTLRLAALVLMGIALFFGLDLPRFFLPGWSPLERTALDALGQLVAYAGMGALALLIDDRRGAGSDKITSL
ncbi:hypothetical protein ESB00_16370 [Oleiharenicola lentus]|uniref:Uncharacterized protein n=1 Tax=Oleiharenicola lentus TaxID=2508720 RepID=A0A4Q1C4Q2_9BACT|nr:hypothetical protein [Oleiharenicola lentus]RXK53273.1 hypothetical protein ESB00_16370 [Oleiharenicola lentus]